MGRKDKKPKMPRKITHEERLVKCEDDLVYFIKNISILGEKLGIILVQLPPDFTLNLTVLENFLEVLPKIKIKDFLKWSVYIKMVFSVYTGYIGICVIHNNITSIGI